MRWLRRLVRRKETCVVCGARTADFAYGGDEARREDPVCLGDAMLLALGGQVVVPRQPQRSRSVWRRAS